MNATVMAVVNQKGGTGKTITCENLGVGLAMEGKRVLLVDADPQANLTIALGWNDPDAIPVTLTDLMESAMRDTPMDPTSVILHHEEGVDLIPSNISLAGTDMLLVTSMTRESILKQCLEPLKKQYDFILLDCGPSLGMLTVNALAAANRVIIPVEPQYLSAKGMELLLKTINRVRRQINPKLKIEGVLITKTDSRTNYSKEITNLIRETYGKKLNVYGTSIPRSIRAAEITSEGKSIFKYDPRGKVAEAYSALTKEVVRNAEISRKKQLEQLR